LIDVKAAKQVTILMHLVIVEGHTGWNYFSKISFQNYDFSEKRFSIFKWFAIEKIFISRLIFVK